MTPSDTKVRHRLNPRAFLELKVPHSPHVSPDGKRVVFEVAEADFEESRYVSRLWIAEIPEATPYPPSEDSPTATTEIKARQVTFSYEGERAPRWSPDGRHIVFLSSRPDMTEPPPEDEEDEHKDQLWLLPVVGGEAFKLTSAKEGVRDYAWSPDGQSVIYLTDEAKPQPLEFVHSDRRKRKVDAVVEHDERPRRQFWEVNVEEKKPELLYLGDPGIADFCLSPEGTKIAYISNETGDPNDYHNFDLFVLEIGEPDADSDADSEADSESKPPAEPKRVVERSGAKFNPQWSPDGSQIAFIAGRDPSLSYAQECVWTVSSGGGVPTNQFESQTYDAHEIIWPKQGDLRSLVSERTNRPLVAISAGQINVITGQNATGECSDFGVSPDGGIVVAVMEDDKTPPELYVVGVGGDFRALTDLNKDFVERYELPRQELVRWQTDAGEIEGVLIHPAGSSPREPLPLIVQVHGGPKGHAVNTLRSYYQHGTWAAEGYRVLLPNFRGSEGYGHEFAVSNRRDLGGGDFRDIMAGVDLVIEQGLADPRRIGIMGGSYGGYMTNWAIGQTDRFAAAISMFGIFNLVTDYSNSALSRWDPEYMGAYYWEDPDVYLRCSPSTNLEKINTPVLILHGESDDNTFISNSREMYQALRARGVTCQFVHYPREGHGVREPNHKLDEMRRCLAWFDRYLMHAGELPPRYRIEDKIKHDGYEFHLTRVEEGEFAGRTEEDARLLEISFSLASDEPVETGWQLSLANGVLKSSESVECPLAGVPLNAGGGKFLVEGRELTVNLQPDEKTGRLSVALSLVYQIPVEGGEFSFQLADFPPVRFDVGPKPDKPEGESDIQEGGESKAPASSTTDETPLETPREG